MVKKPVRTTKEDSGPARFVEEGHEKFERGRLEGREREDGENHNGGQNTLRQGE
jgi:hypothetical protein